MFGTIRRHQKWLWFVIAGLTIISFVAFGPTNSRMGNALGRRDGSSVGMLNGQPISQEDFVKARNEVLLDGFLFYSPGEWPDAPNSGKSSWEIQRDAYFRLLMRQKEKELGIQVNADAVADMARQILAALQLGNLDAFEQKVLAPHGMTLDDFDRCLRGRVALLQMAAVAGSSGKLVTPQEAADLYRKEHQELSASMVYFSASNYLSSVTVTPEALSQYYSNRQATYAIPTRVQVNYVRFNVTNYLEQAQSKLTNITKLVDDEYAKYGTNTDVLAKTPEEAKAKLRNQFMRQEALFLARKDANKFVDELSRMPSKSVTNLQVLAAQKGQTVGVTEPFDQQEGPKGWDVSEAFLKAAFALTPDEPISVEVPAADGYYVLGYNKVIPSEIPPLKSIEAKVTADYRMAIAGLTARQAGAKFAESLTNGLPAGKSFAGVAADAGLKVESLPPFSLSTTNLPPSVEDRISIGALKQAGFETELGKVSQFKPTRDGGFVLYAQSFAPVNEDQLKREVPEFLAYLRQVRQSDAFNQWFNQQIQQDAGLTQTLRSLMEQAQKERSNTRRAAS